MQNQKSVPNGKALRSKFIKMALTCVAIYIGYGVVDILPAILKAVILTAIVVGYIIPKYFPKAKATAGNARAAGGKAVSRAVRASKALYAMSDEEFDSRFPAGMPPQAPVAETQAPAAPPVSYVPQHLCVQRPVPQPQQPRISANDAALEWWNEESEDGTAGVSRVSELIARIAYEDPSKHTCVLSEYEELRLPEDPAILTALVGVMKENGLEADLNEDNLLTVFWNQYEDGMEAAQAHAAGR